VSTPSANCQQQQTGVLSLAEEKNIFINFRQNKNKALFVCQVELLPLSQTMSLLNIKQRTFRFLLGLIDALQIGFVLVFVTYSSVANSGETKRELTRTEFCHLATMVPAHTLWSIKACQYPSDNNSEA